MICLTKAVVPGLDNTASRKVPTARTSRCQIKRIDISVVNRIATIGRVFLMVKKRLIEDCESCSKNVGSSAFSQIEGYDRCEMGDI